MTWFGQFQGAPRENLQPVLNPNPHQWSAVRVAGAYLIAGLLWIGLSDLTLAESGGLTASGFLVSAGKGILFVLLSSGLVFWLCRREFRNTARTMALLRTVVDGTADAVFVKDREGRYLLVNEAAAQFMGRSVADILGRDDRELFKSDEGERLMAHDREILAGLDSVMIEEELTTSGMKRIYQATKTPYFDAAGQAAGLIGIGRNVTDRVQVEAALRESDARLREAQRIARLGSWSWEPPTNKVWWSDAEFELFGLDPNAVRPGLESFLALLHPDDRPAALARVDAMLAGANEFANNLRVILRDGTCMWIHSQARATRDAAGKLLRVDGTDQDVTAQHLAREAAAESERRLQAAVEVAELGIILVDYEQQSVDLSPRAAEQFGLALCAPMTRSDLHSRFHPDDGDLLESQIANALDAVGSGSFALEHRVIRPDGTTRWLNVRKQVSFADGRPRAAMVVTADVTDRRQAEARLREQEMLVREAAELARVGGWGFDPVTLQSDWTPEVAHMYGLDPDAAPAMTDALNFFCPEQRPALQIAMAAAMQDGIPHDMELRLTAANGVKKWVRTICRPIVENGKVVRVRGSLQDITDRKRVESELRASEERYRMLFDSNPHPMWVYDVDSLRFLAVNDAAVCAYGYTREEFLAMTIREIRPAEDVPKLEADVARTVRGLSRSTQWKHRRKDGTIFDVEISSHDLPDEHSNSRLVLALDVTARKQLEDQFRQSQKLEAVGRLAGGVAHDFNNLLTVINGYSELILSDLPVDDQAREPLAAIHDAGQRAARLTKQLLALSRKSMIEPRLIDLNELVAESAKLFRRLIGEDIALLVLADPAPVRVILDPGQIEQVLMNLVVNARDAMPTGGRLTIETRNVELGLTVDQSQPNLPPGRYASLQVIDTGCGMSPEIMEKIFEPFFTTKGVGEGSGLGLAVVHGVVQQSDGSISTQSVEGKGTSFKILLPATQDKANESVLSETSASLEGGETVLVVEDEEAVCKLVRLSLEGHGYKVYSAATGRDALELLQTQSGTVNLLITDVIMPGISGRELAEAARRDRPELKVLYMSGYTDDALGRHGMKETSDQFLQKPFTPLGLVRKVRVILDHSENT